MCKTYLKSTAIMLLGLLTVLISPDSFAQGALSEPSVRLIYFLPKDRPIRQDRIEAFRELIKDAQEFYADEIQRHGHGRKTFRVETDRSGEPIVHRFNGRFNERHYYQRLTDFKVWEEFFQQVNDLQHVYLIAIDLSYELLNEGESCGLGGVTFSHPNADASFLFGSTAIRHRNITPGEEVLGGSAIMPASGHCFYDTRGFLHPLRLITHELAHAFGLDHDYSDPDSAVGGRGFRFSECDAEWLSVSRFFNSNAVSENASGNIQLISAPTYSAEGIALHFEVTDADGLHQAQLLVPEDGSWGPWKLIGCQELDGQMQRVEFLSSELTSAPERVMLQFMDDLGNITWATFLVDIASLLPPIKVVSIPDPNLKQAIRSQLGLASGDMLTDRAMKKLGSLNATDRKITNIAGLEYATQLRELLIGRNQIKNYDRLAELPNLTTLYLWANNISDLSVLPPMPQLEFLDLNWNQISDVSALAEFTSLKELWLQGNKLADTSTLFQLHNGTFPPAEEVKVMEERDQANRVYKLLTFQSLGLKVRINPDVKVYRSLNAVQNAQTEETAPITGTWFGVSKPSGLAAEDFTIGPGEFVILAHRGKQVTTKQAAVKTYASYYAFNAKENDFPNLANLFKNGGRIELVSHASLNPLPRNTREPQFGDVVISEIMWGLNGSARGKQYIELYNASAHTYTFNDGNLSFRFSTTAQQPLPDETFPLPTNPNAHVKVIDRVSNKGWNVPGKSGNTSKNDPLISMYRTIDYTTRDIPDGTLARSWVESNGRVNLPPPSYGTPGVKHLPPPSVVHIESSQRPPMYWVNEKAGTLHRLVGAEVEDVVPSVQNATGLVLNPAANKIYWTEQVGKNRGRVKCANLDGSNVQVLANIKSGVPRSIAVDTTQGKLYWANSRGRIQRANLNGKGIRNIIQNLKSPENITVDLAGGTLYWTEDTGRIRRANLNGKSIENIASGLSPVSDIAISGNKLYWTEITGGNRGKIGRVNLNASNARTLAMPLNDVLDIAVDAVGKKLYWLDSAGNIRRSNLAGRYIKNVVSGLAPLADFALGSSGEAIAAAPPISALLQESTQLQPNFPNPFNPETWIPYQLSNPADVSISIYAADGQLIRTLDLGHQPRGIYESRNRAAYWDGRNALGESVASGVYFYTLTAGDFTATRKMLILK